MNQVNSKNITIVKQKDVGLIKLNLSKNINSNKSSDVFNSKIAKQGNSIIQYESKNYTNYKPLKINDEKNTIRVVLCRTLCYLYLFCDKNIMAGGYPYIKSKGAINVRDIVEDIFLMSQFEEIIEYSIAGSLAMSSNYGLVSIDEGIIIERARYANYESCKEKIKRTKQHFLYTESNTIAEIIETDSIQCFIECIKETKDEINNYICGIQDAIKYNVYGSRLKFLNKGDSILRKFINDVLDNIINIVE